MRPLVRAPGRRTTIEWVRVASGTYVARIDGRLTSWRAVRNDNEGPRSPIQWVLIRSEQDDWPPAKEDGTLAGLTKWLSNYLQTRITREYHHMLREVTPRKLNEEEWRAVLLSLAAKIPPTFHPPRVTLIGGVAMALGYSSRRTTDDADVIMTPDVAAEVLPAAEQVAVEYGLPSGWMNTKALDAGYVVPPTDPGRIVLATGSVVFEVPSTEHLLAMKVARFASETDRKDAEILLKKLLPSVSDVETLWDFLGGFVPPSQRLQARYNLDTLWEMLNEST